MARDQIDMTPLQSRDELVAWLAAGVKPPSEFRIGTEHEKTPFTLAGPSSRALRRRARHRRAAGGHAAPARLGADHGARQHHRPVRRHRRRRDFAGARRAVRTVRRAGRDRAPDPVRTDGASGAGARDRNPARHRLSRARHDAVMVAGADPGDAQGPLQDHDQLHAEGRPVRPRHDVPDLHGADQSRLLVGSRHGQEAARLGRAAAGRHRAVRQFAVHRRQAQRLPVVPLRDLARHRQCARRA